MRLELARAHHARTVAATMRTHDIAEIMDGWGKDPEPAILEALEASYFARTMFCELEPVCIYGLAPLVLLTGTARFWIFATEAVDRHPLGFARACRRALPELASHFKLATNLIDSSDAPAMRWMQWLGGTCALPAQSRGGRLFAQFFLTGSASKVKACRQA